MIAVPTEQELRQIVALKYGELAQMGWGPRRRHRFGFFTPDDWYEAFLNRLVNSATRWLDVGGGASIFPYNPALARELSKRCTRLTGVDPSANIHDNPFVHDRAQCLIEEFDSDDRFDLATLRMVAEHITDPPRVIAKLRELLVPGGLAVICTVNYWSPITLISSLTPHRWHHPVKYLFWGGEERDTFPVAYRMNTRQTLRRLFQQQGFDERLFQYLDDLATFSQVPVLNAVELMSWRLLRSVGLRYPETCLLGVYQRRES